MKQLLLAVALVAGCAVGEMPGDPTAYEACAGAFVCVVDECAGARLEWNEGGHFDADCIESCANEWYVEPGQYESLGPSSTGADAGNCWAGEPLDSDMIPCPPETIAVCDVYGD